MARRQRRTVRRPGRRRSRIGAGIGEYLTKPLDGAALLGCIDRLLADPAHRR